MGGGQTVPWSCERHTRRNNEGRSKWSSYRLFNTLGTYEANTSLSPRLWARFWGTWSGSSSARPGRNCRDPWSQRHYAPQQWTTRSVLQLNRYSTWRLASYNTRYLRRWGVELYFLPWPPFFSFSSSLSSFSKNVLVEINLFIISYIASKLW